MSNNAPQDTNTASSTDTAADGQRQQVDAWWQEEGKAMWDARLQLPEFLGQQVFVIRFARHGEAYMPFVTLGRERAYGQERIKLTVGGLIGSTFRQYDGSVQTRINTYSSSGATARTLPEALYAITH